MTSTTASSATLKAKPPNRYRLPGIEREGIAQLSLLETALWPLQGGRLPDNKFETRYDYSIGTGRKNATVTVRAASGLQSVDELILWGLLGATLRTKDAEPVLLATPYWMLKHLGLETGGSQYAELRESLLRLAFTSYQNDGFYNPETQEREYAAFQFLSILLPTVGGAGETVDNDRCWRIEWNPAFFRFCRASGGNLLFDLELFRMLTPASRRLFLKLKDRFWRSKRVFMNVEDLTVNGLGFAANRPLRKRKFDLTNCIRELLDVQVLTLGRGQTDAKESFLKRGKGSYVVVFHEGEYFRQATSERVQRQKNAIVDDPLYDPLRKIGVDGPGIQRLLKDHGRKLIQRWVRITDAAMHEQPRGFVGFRVSPAAFLIDGVQNNRTPPDWLFAHEKRQERQKWEHAKASSSVDENGTRLEYEKERQKALQMFISSPDGRQKYDQAFACYKAFYQTTEPHRAHEAADEATLARLERLDFRFPEYTEWTLTKQASVAVRNA